MGKISLRLGDAQLPSFHVDKLPRRAELTRAMLVRALDAFVDLDVGLARSVPRGDDQVDALFNYLYGDIINFVAENPAEVERASQLEWAMHNMERAADRTTNICEWVVYLTTGVYAEMDTAYGRLSLEV